MTETELRQGRTNFRERILQEGGGITILRERENVRHKLARRNYDGRPGSSTETKICWLQEFLPTYLPHARVSTYGYDLDEEGISAAEIDEKARKLLDVLCNEKLAETVSSPFQSENHGKLPGNFNWIK
jgi:hypothetical protein